VFSARCLFKSSFFLIHIHRLLVCILNDDCILCYIVLNFVLIMCIIIIIVVLNVVVILFK